MFERPCLTRHRVARRCLGPVYHQQGRCIFVAETKSWADPGFTGTEDPSWTSNLRRTTGLNLTDRVEMLHNGLISWADRSTRRDNPNWRPAYYETPVKTLKQKAGVQ